MIPASLQECIGDELDRASPAAVAELAAELARRGGNSTAAVLYYGSTLRAENLDGILDFYVLLDDVSAWPGSAFAHLANRLLPPNVGYLEFNTAGQQLRAKYAVMTLEQFRSRTSLRTLDTTIWARFCQPALCIWARSKQDRLKAAELVAGAVITAARWAVELGPTAAAAGDFWRALFARTYAAELRVESSGRARDIVGKSADRYAALLPLALQQLQIGFQSDAQGLVTPQVSQTQRLQAEHRWKARARWGRPLNVLRLLKASFTFEGAMDYVVWKIERHRGVKINVSPWQRRFPLLAAPALYWQLRRRGIL